MLVALDIWRSMGQEAAVEDDVPGKSRGLSASRPHFDKRFTTWLAVRNLHAAQPQSSKTNEMSSAEPWRVMKAPSWET